MSSILHQIINQSGHPDFKVYLTGSPAFFNVDTEWCNDVTFYCWFPHHKVLPTETVSPFLDKDLRLKLNNVVIALNNFLASLVNEVNGQLSSPRVVFVDTNSAFNSHRFCEQDSGQDVHEPDSTRTDTWFFLAGWPDQTLEEQGTLSIDIDSDVVTQGNTTALPDPNTCADSKSTD